MYECVKNKFEMNEDLKQKLLDTGEAELINGNMYEDDYWGVYNGKGENKSRKILMRVREELKYLSTEPE